MSTVLTTPARPVGAGVTPDASFGIKAVAVVACVAVGLRIDLVKGITPGIVVMIVLLPVWWAQVRSSRLVGWLVGLTGLALASGFLLAWTAKVERAVDWRNASSVGFLVALTFAGIVVLLWARTVISVSSTLASLVVGIILFELSTPGSWAVDPWKFAFARPITILVLLAVAWSSKRAGRARPWLTVVALAVLAGVGVVFDYRSESGFLMLTAVLVLWQAIVVGRTRRLKALSPALLLITVAGAVYLGATQLFVSGLLGTAVQERSTAQIDASGSLLLGGRPEWATTVRLMGNRPDGYGLGVLADSIDTQLAENGFVAIHADPASGYEGYIANYMLADGFHLHSTAADLWAVTGICGLLLAAFVVGLVVWSLSTSLAVGRAEPLLIYLAIVVLWDIAFSPMYSAATEIVLGLFVAVVSWQHVRAVRGAGVATPASPAVVDRPSGPVLYGAASAAPGSNGGSRGTL